jgi:hypothetical protein
METGIGILNVGAGDTKIVFDKNNPADCIRAARIVKDMLRRGYALLVEVDQPDGTKAFQRVLEFREDSCEYVIADFDPLVAQQTDQEEARTDESSGEASAAAQPPTGDERPKRKLTKRGIPAAGARGVAVARSAGG